MAESGKGLLYVGERGTWYPNRGLAMCDFDLTFHYPAGLDAAGYRQTHAGFDSLTVTSKSGTGYRNGPSQWRASTWGNMFKGRRRQATSRSKVTPRQWSRRNSKNRRRSRVQMDPNPALPQIQPIVMAPAPPSPARNASAVAEASAAAIRYYAQRFGPFPYSQLSLTQLPGRSSQGWPGLIFLSSYAFLSKDERENLHMSPATALSTQLVPAHETAHQWWGDLITWSTYRDQWFSEGLANYSALMILQEKDPAGFRLILDKYRDELADKNKDGNFPRDAGPVTLGGRLLSSHFPEGYEAINYGRGTWLFHMLRSMMQDAATENARKNPGSAAAEEPFVRSLRKVRERYAGKSVSTRELLKVFAEDLPPSARYEGKASLDWFLDGWINGTALPKLELQNVRFTAKANSVLVSGTIRQKDSPEELVTSVPIYAVASGRAPTFAGRVFADGAESSFHLSAPAGTHKILLDVNGTILTGAK